MFNEDDRVICSVTCSYEFRMTEYDADGNIVREVAKSFNAPASITHPEVTEEYNAFLKGCGYVWHLNDGVEFVRRSSED